MAEQQSSARVTHSEAQLQKFRLGQVRYQEDLSNLRDQMGEVSARMGKMGSKLDELITAVKQYVIDRGKDSPGLRPSPAEASVRGSNGRFDRHGQDRGFTEYQPYRSVGGPQLQRDPRTGMNPVPLHFPKIDFPKFNGDDPKGWYLKPLASLQEGYLKSVSKKQENDEEDFSNDKSSCSYSVHHSGEIGQILEVEPDPRQLNVVMEDTPSPNLEVVMCPREESSVIGNGQEGDPELHFTEVSAVCGKVFGVVENNAHTYKPNAAEMEATHPFPAGIFIPHIMPEIGVYGGASMAELRTVLGNPSNGYRGKALECGVAKIAIVWFRGPNPGGTHSCQLFPTLSISSLRIRMIWRSGYCHDLGKRRRFISGF